MEPLAQAVRGLMRRRPAERNARLYRGQMACTFHPDRLAVPGHWLCPPCRYIEDPYE
jgi:hypothetical protein